MGLPDEGAWIKACVARFARCASDGTTPAGVSNGKIIHNFISINQTQEVTTGVDHSVPNACGDIPYPVRDRDIIVRAGLEMEVMYYDPHLAEMLCARPIIFSTPAAARTPTGNITTGSDIVTNISGGVTNADMRSTIAATGIPVGSVISEIISANSVRIILAATGASSVATATTVGVTLTITPVPLAIGNQGPNLGVAPTDFGVTMEVWSNIYVGGAPAPFLPYGRTDFARTFWRPGDDDFGNSRKSMRFIGYAVDNINYGNGPWNDHVDASPSTKTIVEAWAQYRTATIPTPVVGYSPVPTQVP
jgi:hypothetical protein